jgi:hypothetical protein
VISIHGLFHLEFHQSILIFTVLKVDLVHPLVAEVVGLQALLLLPLVPQSIFM